MGPEEEVPIEKINLIDEDCINVLVKLFIPIYLTAEFPNSGFNQFV